MLKKVFKVRYLLAIGLGLFLPKLASAQLIESWENTLDGWAVPPSYNLQNGAGQFGPVTTAFSSSTGVTNGSYSLAITGTGTGGPNYQQLLAGPSSTGLTNLLSNASALSLDVDTPAGSFGYYLQFQFIINGGGLGFYTINGSYLGTNIGSETTLSVPITPAMDATLAANPTVASAILIQVGGGNSAGNETMYVDNLTATPVPEPVSIGAMLSGIGLLMLRRHRGSRV